MKLSQMQKRDIRGNAGKSLTLQSLGILGPLGGVLLQAIADQAQHDLELWVVSGLRVWDCAVLGIGLLSLGTLCTYTEPGQCWLVLHPNGKSRLERMVFGECIEPVHID